MEVALMLIFNMGRYKNGDTLKLLSMHWCCKQSQGFEVFFIS